MTERINSTLDVLKGHLTGAAAKRGVEAIRQWEADLEEADWRGSKSIHADLVKLRRHLESGVLDGVVVGALLVKLGGSTVYAAAHTEGHTGGKLESLGRALVQAGKGLRADVGQSMRGRELGLAREELRAKDPVLRGLIDANPELDVDAWRQSLPVKGLFEALLFQIVGQQISVSAMNAIYTRLRALFPGGKPDPEILAGTPGDVLRGIGLSARKAEYARDLARRAVAGELDGMADLPHEEARKRLVSLRGIGPWTADGALLIAFGWSDVLVAGDLVLRKAVQRAYGLPALPSEKEVEAIGERWKPHRTLAAGYLFESMGLATI